MAPFVRDCFLDTKTPMVQACLDLGNEDCAQDNKTLQAWSTSENCQPWIQNLMQELRLNVSKEGFFLPWNNKTMKPEGVVGKMIKQHNFGMHKQVCPTVFEINLLVKGNPTKYLVHFSYGADARKHPHPYLSGGQNESDAEALVLMEAIGTLRKEESGKGLSAYVQLNVNGELSEVAVLKAIEYISHSEKIVEICIGEDVIAFASDLDMSKDDRDYGMPPSVVVIRSVNGSNVGLHTVLEKVMADPKTRALMRPHYLQVRILLYDTQDSELREKSKFVALSEKKWLIAYQPILTSLLLSEPASKASVVLEPFPYTVYTDVLLPDSGRLGDRKDYADMIKYWNEKEEACMKKRKLASAGDCEVQVGCKRKAAVGPEKLDACDAVQAVQTLLFGNKQDANARSGMVTQWVAAKV